MRSYIVPVCVLPYPRVTASHPLACDYVACRLENTLDFRMERVWSVGVCKGSNSIAIGYDEGAVMIKVGKEEPVASMDASGKVIWAKHSEIQTVNIKSLGPDYEMVDGERLPLAVKDLGSSDAYPQSLQHGPNGRFVTVCGDGEFVVYTALAWRNKSFGQALDFAWSADSNEYAVRESVSRVKVFKNFTEKARVGRRHCGWSNRGTGVWCAWTSHVAKKRTRRV